jgi:hypothetical protein
MPTSANPLDFFERSIRSKEEHDGPIPDLEIDALLGFGDPESARLFEALSGYYPAGHWALDRSSFRHAIEKAMQLLSAGLCSLDARKRDAAHPLECCARIVNAPTLSPYIRQSEFNYVIVPTGFVSSLEKFISSTYAMAAAYASREDPERKMPIWDEDLFLGAVAALADKDIFTFTRGVFEASAESAMQQVLEDHSDPLAFMAFDREGHRELLKGMPSASGWGTFGFRDLDEALANHRPTKAHARKIARLAVCFTICHEFGHVFTLSINEEGARELSADEAFTDMIGALILYRLIEAGVLPVIVGTEVSPRDLGDALAAFHAWNLSKQLAELLKPPELVDTDDALRRIHEVAGRWKKAMALIGKVWTDGVPALARIDGAATTGFLIVNHWAVMPAGMLRVALLNKGHSMDIEKAGRVLPLLANRDSKIYAYLAG